MQRVEAGGDWSLFCPSEAPGLADVWGEEFEALYTRYEAEGRAKKVVKAQQLWFAILEAQVETGNPYMLYKDACNRKSNQQARGRRRGGARGPRSQSGRVRAGVGCGVARPTGAGGPSRLYGTAAVTARG